ncbi:MAG TPA: VOC family protein [Rhizomicrobium sp.]|nr:VOC family protein [Rhizomicrobium sp.]
MARITGIGGVFFKAKDPRALAAWYGETLGLAIESWGGAMVRNDGGPAFAVWSPFAADTGYFAPSGKPFMINFAVDDLDGFIAQLEARGVAILKRADEGEMGLFAWLMDPDGNKVELWQPAK